MPMEGRNQILDQDINVEKTNGIKVEMEFPLNFTFKLSSLANDFTVQDAKGENIAYVRQKMFKLKEAISVYKDDSKTKVLYKIDADRIIDFNASYTFTDANNEELGKVARKGRKSILKALYLIFNNKNEQEYTITEENPWAKFFDAMMGEVPIAGIFTGLMFNPRYVVKDTNDQIVARFSKEKSMFGRKFKLEKYSDLSEDQAERIILSLMMMSLLERRRG